jgi:hypothetical protein
MSVTTLAAAIPQLGSAFLMPYLVTRFHSWEAPLLVTVRESLLHSSLIDNLRVEFDRCIDLGVVFHRKASRRRSRRKRECS